MRGVFQTTMDLIKRRPLMVVTHLIAVGFLAVAQWRTVTYVCGNDPMVYIRTARMLLHPSMYDAETLKAALVAVAPGYSLLLAAGIACFGSLSPYWINAGILMAMIPLMWWVFRRLMGTDQAAALSLLGLLLIAFRSHELNAPYLLYPFREVARWLFVFLAFGSVLKGADKRLRRGWVISGGIALLLACVIREPSALILPGLLAGILCLNGGWKLRGATIGWVLLPWALAGFAGMLVLLRVSLFEISQFSVLTYLLNHDVALARGREMLGWFPSRVGWVAVAAMMVGMLRAAFAGRMLLGWFLLPGILFFVFCAYMQMHVRYFLTSLLFLAVFAGYGLDGALVLAGRLVRRVDLRGRTAAWMAAVCLAVICFGLFHTARGLRPWGPVLRASDVREWQDLAKTLPPSADGRVRVAVEQRSRFLEDMLLSYTDVEVLDPKTVDQWPADWAPAYYYRPLNRQALYDTPQWLMWRKVYAHRILEDRMNLLPDGGDSPVVRTIGQGRYAGHVLTPWESGTHRQEVTLETGQDHILWLDWGRADPHTRRMVDVRGRGTGAVWFEGMVTGNGIQAIYVPGEWVHEAHGVMTVTSTNPCPARPVFAVLPVDRAWHVDFGHDRRLSARRTLLMGEDDLEEQFVLELKSGRWIPFRTPVVHGANGSWQVRLGGRHEGSGSFTICLRRPDGVMMLRDAPAGDAHVVFDVEAGQPVELCLGVSEAPMRVKLDVGTLSMQYRVKR